MIVDPRSPLKYLQGHVANAVNIPVSNLFDKESLALLPDSELSTIFQEAGVNTHIPVALYDAYDGQNAAFQAWILEYLGHPQVHVVLTLFQGLVEQGFEVRYKPVKPSPKQFEKKTVSKIRASSQDLTQQKNLKLVDVRSKDEFTGKLNTESRAGHLPGAINLPWTELLGANHNMLKPINELTEVLREAKLQPSDKIVTYCSYGPRAATAYLALIASGYKDLRIYDGSFHQWALQTNLPVEA